MKSAADIVSINTQICAVSARIGVLAAGMNASEAVSKTLGAVYEDQLVDEVKHLQMLVIELTKKVSGDESETDYSPLYGEGNTDEGGSAFAQGELTSVIGRKETEYPGSDDR